MRRSSSAFLFLCALTCVVAFAALPGCSSSPGCDRVLCGACPTPISIRVTLTAGGTGPVTVSGPGGVTCAPIPSGEQLCSSGTAGPGSYSLVLSAPGHDPRTLSFTLAAAPATCCACGGSYSDAVDLLPLGASDAGVRDGGVRDSGALDAPAPADAALDAAADDAGDAAQDDAGIPCAPGAVAFPMGGSLAVGTLCDDVFACVESAAQRAAILAATDRFVCETTTEGGCASGERCRYADPGGPSTLDQAEIAAICAASLVTPTPSLVCRVYL